MQRLLCLLLVAVTDLGLTDRIEALIPTSAARLDRPLALLREGSALSRGTDLPLPASCRGGGRRRRTDSGRGHCHADHVRDVTDCRLPVWGLF